MDCALCGIVDRVVAWLERPFRSDGSALDWFLFLGLLIVLLWMWQTILLLIHEEM